MAGLVRRLFGRPAPADLDQDGAPAPVPAPAPVDADDGRAGWVDLPPTPSAVGSPSLTVQTSAFEETLATRHNPLFLEPLGHHVSGGAPSGIVHGIAEVVSHPPSPAPGVTVQTFAPRPPRVEDLRGALVPQLAPTSPAAVDGTRSGAVPAAPSPPVLQRTAVASSGVDPVGSSPPVSFTRAPDPAPLPRVLEVTAQDPMPVDAVHTDPASETEAETVVGRAVDDGIERQAPTLNRADDDVAPASPALPAVAGGPDGHLPTVDLPTIQRSLDAGSDLNEPAPLSRASLSPAPLSPVSVSPVDQGAAAITPTVEAPAPLLQSPLAPAGAVGGDFLDSSAGTAVDGVAAIAPTIDHSPPSMPPSSTTAPVRSVQRLGLGEPIRSGDRSPLSDPLPLQRRVEATSAGTPAPASPASVGIGESTPQAEAAFTEHAEPVRPVLPEVGKGIVAQAASSSESIGDGGEGASTVGVEVEEAPLIGAGAPSASPPFALLPEPATTDPVSGGTRDTPPPLAVQTLPEQTTKAEAGDTSSMPEAADAVPPVGSMPAGVTNPGATDSDATDPVGVVPTLTTGVAPMSAPFVESGSVESAPALASRPVQRAGSREVGSAPLGSAPVLAHRAPEVPVVQRQILADGGEDTNVGVNSSVGTSAASPLPVAPWPLGENTGAAHDTEPNTADLGAGGGPATESGQSPLSLPQVALMSARPLIAPSLSQSSGPRPSSGPVVSRWMDGRVDDHRGDQQGNASTDQSPAFGRSPEPEPTPFWTAISRLPVDDSPPSGPNALPGPALVAQRAPGPQPATGSVAVGQRLSLGAPIPVKAGTAPDLPLVLPAAAPARGQVIQREVEVPQDAPVPPPPPPPPAPPAPAPAAASTSGGQPAPTAAAGGAGQNLDELSRQLYDRIRDRLRAELRLDRERAGIVSDRIG